MQSTSQSNIFIWLHNKGSLGLDVLTLSVWQGVSTDLAKLRRMTNQRSVLINALVVTWPNSRLIGQMAFRLSTGNNEASHKLNALLAIPDLWITPGWSATRK
jgi:hypothetical protein